MFSWPSNSLTTYKFTPRCTKLLAKLWRKLTHTTSPLIPLLAKEMEFVMDAWTEKENIFKCD